MKSHRILGFLRAPAITGAAGPLRSRGLGGAAGVAAAARGAFAAPGTVQWAPGDRGRQGDGQFPKKKGNPRNWIKLGGWVSLIFVWYLTL